MKWACGLPPSRRGEARIGTPHTPSLRKQPGSNKSLMNLKIILMGMKFFSCEFQLC